MYLLPRGDLAQNVSLPSAPFVAPAGIFVNASNKDVYVADGSQVVRIPGGTGTPIILPVPSLTPPLNGWSQATDVFQDARGTLWVTNFDPPSVVAIPADDPPFYLAPTAYSWHQPHSILVTPNGTIHVREGKCEKQSASRGSAARPTAPLFRATVFFCAPMPRPASQFCLRFRQPRDRPHW